MDHGHRLELRIIIPRRAPIRIDMDAQDMRPDDPELPSTRDPITAALSPIASKH